MAVLIEALQTLQDPSHVAGLSVVEDTVTLPGLVATVLSVVGAADLVWDDGLGGGALPASFSPFPPAGYPAGGVNTFLSECERFTLLRLRPLSALGAPLPWVEIYNDTGPVGSIDLASFQVSGDSGATFTPVVAGGFWANTSKLVVITAAPWFDFTPYASASGGGITSTTTQYDFTVDLLGDSLCTAIDRDRLTVTLPVDGRSMQPRGTPHPGGENWEFRFDPGNVRLTLRDSADVPVPVTSTFWDSLYTNGGAPFTLRPRGADPLATFAGGSTSFRVMGFEGYANTDLDVGGLGPLVFAPTARMGGAAPLLNALLLAGEASDAGDVQGPRDNRLVLVDVADIRAGSLGEVAPGDFAYIYQGDVDASATNASPLGGTYLIRGVVEPSPGTPQRRDWTRAVRPGDATGPLDLSFPRVVSYEAGDLTIRGAADFGGAYEFWPSGATPALSPVATGGGRVYLISDPARAAATTDLGTLVMSAAYTSYNPATQVFAGLSDWRDGNFDPSTEALWTSAARGASTVVSGFRKVPVGTGPLPGYVSPTCLFGFRTITAVRGAGSVAYAATVTAGAGSLVNGGDDIAVYAHTPETPTAPIAPGAASHAGTPAVLDFGSFGWAAWRAASFPLEPLGKDCFLPGDIFEVAYSGAAGLFLEPTWPRPTTDRARLTPTIVDVDNTLGTGEVGLPPITEYVSGLAPAPGAPWMAYASVDVRRGRRFSAPNDSLSEALLTARDAVEEPLGRVLWTARVGGSEMLVADPVDVWGEASPGGEATTLGGFLRVVKPGSWVLFGDERVPVVCVQSDDTLHLAWTPEATPAPGSPFRVFCPREPSVETALRLARETLAERVYVRTPDPTGVTYGGRVAWDGTPPTDQERYDASANILRDFDATLDFRDHVEVGDWIRVPPAGLLNYFTPLGLRGEGPRGDVSVPGRPSHAAGAPTADRDDNRGAYRVVAVSASSVTLTPSGLYAGGVGTSVVVGPVGEEFALYPVVTGSNLSGPGTGEEGQGDLRPTAPYPSGAYSFEPFGYEVWRPREGVTAEEMALVFELSERAESWIEVLRASAGDPSFYAFQQAGSIAALSTVFDNNRIADLLGLYGIAPYEGSASASGALGRRVLHGDERLLYQTPRGSGTAYVSPWEGSALDKIRQLLTRWHEERWTRLTARTSLLGGSGRLLAR
jgi:hypothetical protein